MRALPLGSEDKRKQRMGWGEDEKRKRKKGGSRKNYHPPAKEDVCEEFRAKRKAGVEIREKHMWKRQELQLGQFTSYTGWLDLCITLYTALDG